MLGPRDDDCVTQNGSTMMIEDDRRLRLRLLLLLLRRAFSAAGCPKTLLPVAWILEGSPGRPALTRRRLPPPPSPSPPPVVSEPWRRIHTTALPGVHSGAEEHPPGTSCTAVRRRRPEGSKAPAAVSQRLMVRSGRNGQRRRQPRHGQRGQRRSGRARMPC